MSMTVDRSHRSMIKYVMDILCDLMNHKKFKHMKRLEIGTTAQPAGGYGMLRLRMDNLEITTNNLEFRTVMYRLSAVHRL